jgi:hypothetical protein
MSSPPTPSRVLKIFDEAYAKYLASKHLDQPSAPSTPAMSTNIGKEDDDTDMLSPPSSLDSSVPATAVAATTVGQSADFKASKSGAKFVIANLPSNAPWIWAIGEENISFSPFVRVISSLSSNNSSGWVRLYIKSDQPIPGGLSKAAVKELLFKYGITAVAIAPMYGKSSGLLNSSAFVWIANTEDAEYLLSLSDVQHPTLLVPLSITLAVDNRADKKKKNKGNNNNNNNNTNNNNRN